MNKEVLNTLILGYLEENKSPVAKAARKNLKTVPLPAGTPGFQAVFQHFMNTAPSKQKKCFAKFTTAVNGAAKQNGKVNGKDDSEDSDSEEELAPAKKTAPAKVPAKKAQESSSEEDSSSEDEKPAKKTPQAASAKKPTPAKAPAKPAKQEESSSEEDSSEEEAAPAKPTPAKKAQTPAKKVQTPAKKAQTPVKPAAEESSSDEDSEEEAPSAKKQPAGKKTKAAVKQTKQESSSEESSDEDEPAPVKKSAPVKAPAKQAEEDSSSDEESSDEEEAPVKKPAAAKKPVASKPVAKEESSSEDSSDEETITVKKTVPVKSAPKKAAQTSKDESSSEESSSDEEEAPAKTQAAAAKTAAVKRKAEESSEEESSGSDEESEEEAPKAPAPTKTPPQKGVKRGRENDDSTNQPQAKKMEGEYNKLFIRGIKDSTSDQLTEYFSQYGEVQVHVVKDRETGESRGFGFAEFTNIEDAKKVLGDGFEHYINDCTVNCRFAEPKPEQNNNRRSGGFNKSFNNDSNAEESNELYVGSIGQLGEDNLYKHFSQFDNLERVKVPTDRDSGESKGFAFVTYKSPADAKAALESGNNIDIDGQSVYMRMARPSGGGGAVSSANTYVSPAYPKRNEPFRRVRAEEITVDPRFDNSFEAKRGATGDWGEKAHKALSVTRGKGFRHEKNKKKKGHYTGGSISMAVNSIKFDD